MWKYRGAQKELQCDFVALEKAETDIVVLHER